ncbi:NACHT domain-containing protein [Amycolatopsis vastitatis]|uniref:NACHT domain-containing protein n=1 Tax=Amycolatopsis vastitatis TaxID=1905142 RepID=UPI0013042EDC|nr:NACHT domain-containing protein [Amycolatopsis vastitatis]
MGKLVLVPLAASPIAVAAWAGRPVPAVLLLAGYTLVAGVLAVTGEIARELRGRWRARIVDRVDRWLVRRLSLFGRRYRDFLLGSLRFIDLKGLATIGFHTPELDEVFVDVSLTFRPPQDVTDSLLPDRRPTGADRRSLQEFLCRPRPVVLALVGAPGSGKTTLLRHTARLICLDHRRHHRRVPILLHLRDHVDAVVSEPEIGLAELVRRAVGRHCGEEPPGWFEHRLRDGNCVVLLDGLDEVARQEDRRKVADWIERQIHHHPTNDFVITSRPQGYRTTGINGAAVLQVRSFTDEQVKRFVGGWYQAVERYRTGARAEDVLAHAAAATEDLLERLDQAVALRDLTVNPLLLTMIANVHRYRGALPGSRADLYSEICQVMLWRRQEAKKLPIELGGDKKELVLRALAFSMMRNRVRDLERADVVAEIGKALKRVSRNLSAEAFLDDVGSNGLLVERESGLYSFAHPTFQEYLAAVHARDKGLVRVLTAAVDDLWWRETILLYAAQADADPIVRACLRIGEVTALSLAVDCAEQSSELAPDLRDRLDEFLAPSPQPGEDADHRRLRAAVALTRHLRQQIQLGNGSRLCARPITGAIYDLYRLDTGAPAPDGPAPSPDAPVTGVRGSDATAFVRWVNDVVVGEPVYRLARRAELDNPVVGRSIARCAWLADTELWLAPGTAHPHLVSAQTLVDYVRDDIERAAPTLLRPLLLKLIPNDRVRSIGHTLMPAGLRDLAHDLAVEHIEVLDLAANLGLEVDRELDSMLVHLLTPEIVRIRTMPLDQVMGRALSDASAEVLRSGAPAAAWARNLAAALAAKAGIAEATAPKPPEELESDVCRIQAEVEEVPCSAWARRVAANLERESLPVLTRQKVLTSSAATALRLAAVCLAAEMRAHEQVQSAKTFHAIAAGITLVQRRAGGQAPPVERIVLATT